jgi:thiamine-monophosphate kinase
MDENTLVSSLTKSWSISARTLIGVGDDCAVLRGSGSRHYSLLKTDTIVEHRHFTPATPPSLVGRKALARVLSDFAAMGGTPTHAVVTLGLPQDYSLVRLRSIYQGLTACAKKYGVDLVGGETTQNPTLLLSIAALGETRGYAPVLRSTAKARDLLFVTGTLGGSQKRHHLTFTPRLLEGKFLAENKLASAMMDLSDGLGSDLPRLCAASQLDYDLDTLNLPLRKGATRTQAYAEGEDYELLFTVPMTKVEKLLERWKFKTRLTCIGGLIHPSKRLPSQQRIPHGYDHLR